LPVHRDNRARPAAKLRANSGRISRAKFQPQYTHHSHLRKMSSAAVADLAEFLDEVDADLLRVFRRMGIAFRLSHSQGATLLLPAEKDRKELVAKYKKTSTKDACDLRDVLLSLIIPFSLSPKDLAGLDSYVNAARGEVKITGKSKDAVTLEGGVTLKPNDNGLFRCDRGETAAPVNFVYDASGLPPKGSPATRSMKDLVTKKAEDNVEGGADTVNRSADFTRIVQRTAGQMAATGESLIPVAAIARILSEVFTSAAESKSPTSGRSDASAILMADGNTSGNAAGVMKSIGSLYAMILPGAKDASEAPIENDLVAAAVRCLDSTVINDEFVNLMDNLGRLKANNVFGASGNIEGDDIATAQSLYDQFKEARANAQQQVQSLGAGRAKEKAEAIAAVYNELCSGGSVLGTQVVSEHGKAMFNVVGAANLMWAQCIKHDMNALGDSCNPTQEDWAELSKNFTDNGNMPIIYLLTQYVCNDASCRNNAIWIRPQCVPDFDKDPLGAYADMVDKALDSFVQDTFLDFGFSQPGVIAGGAEASPNLVEGLRVWSSIGGGDLDALVAAVRGGDAPLASWTE
jgi:hypothetical protein